MTHIKRGPIIGLLAIVLLTAAYALVFSQRSEPAGEDVLGPKSEACTVIMVGKAASVDGSTMTTHTCDCGVCDWTWGHVAAADHKPGATRAIWHINQYIT
jgi:dipeptidase